MAKYAPVITLSEEERTELLRWRRKRNLEQKLVLRANIVMLASQGLGNDQIARELKCSRPTVGLWRSAFVRERLAGLPDRARSGRPKTVDEQIESRILATTLTKPEVGTHWSTRSLGAKLRVSHMTVHRVWKEHRLQPHRTETFRFSQDPALVEKVTDIVGLYLNPPEKALVISVDEKSQIQALSRTSPGSFGQPLLPLRAGLPERRTHDYRRNGTTTLFAALNVAEGKVLGQCYPRHRHEEFLKFLKLIDRGFPVKDLHLIIDNYSPHKHPKVNQWIARHPRFHLHFTPTSASWMNQVETWFSLLSSQQIRRGSFDSVAELIAAIDKFIRHHNQNAKPFAWTKGTEAIQAKAVRNKEINVT